MKVRTVTVDFWGTLMLDPPAIDDSYRARRLSDMTRILRDQNLEFSLPQLTRAYEESGEFLRRIWSGQRDVAVTEHVKVILRTLDTALPDRLSANVMAALVEAYARPLLLVLPAVDPGARPALARLREAGIALVIVSNIMRTPGRVLREVLARFELLDYFAATVFSDELGVRKPHAAIFDAALRAVGGEAVTTVHVGDDPVLDVHGAHAAGLKAIQMLGAGVGGRRGAGQADRTIKRFSELPAAIGALEAS